MARVAEAMLGALGGREVALRFRGAPVTDGSEANPRLGLSATVSEDVALSPAVIRDGGDKTFDLVISGRAVQELVDLRQTGTAQALFDAALGFVVDGKSLTIANVSAELLGGTAYLYRITARE